MKDNIYTINIEDYIRTKKNHFLIKRIIDVVLSIIGIIILTPIYIIIIIAIIIDSKGSPIFKQIRVGKGGENFTIYKFRTMIPDAEKKRSLELNPNDIENFVFQNPNDNRITKIGNLLRKTSLDEIPQLLNVLFGNMSLVGPRPEIPEVVKFYPEGYKQRLLVLPGITGLAQVNGRGEIELGTTVYYDLEYIKEFSIWLDIKIIIKTFVNVVKKEGAF